MTEKLAETRYPIHPLLRRRWSPRAFSERPVEPEKLRSILEAARWAPSSRNEQPWHFIVATQQTPEEYEQLLHCLREGNIEWAQQAPVLMLSVAKRHFDFNGRENKHALHDVGLAVENLVIQATDLGLHVHQMGGFDRDKAQQVFAIPDAYEPVAAIALGYRGDPAQLPDALQKDERAPRTRKPLETFVFSGRWGQKSSLVDEDPS